MVYPMSFVTPNDDVWDGAIVCAPVRADGTAELGVVCWCDGEPFSGPAVQLPERWIVEERKFVSRSCFCSWACALRWSKLYLEDSEFRSMQTKVYACTGDFIDMAPDPFRVLAKFVGPGGISIDTFRQKQKQKADVASVAVIPGHTVTFWSAAVPPPKGPRVTTPATFNSNVSIPPPPPPSTPMDDDANGTEGYRRMRPVTEANTMNTLMQYTTTDA